MQTGESIPDLQVQGTSNLKGPLKALYSNWLVLYFYPKDKTPGCTREGQDFRDRHDAFKALGAVVLGVSRDSLKSHESFREKEGFSFDLLSDADEALCQAFDVIKQKNMYGKSVRGIERSTFLIDKHGIVRHAWRGVKVPSHVDDVLACLEASAKD